MSKGSHPGLLMAPSPAFSGRPGSCSQKMNSPFSTLLHIDSYSSLLAAFEKKSKALTSPISGCHEGFFTKCKEIPLKKRHHFLFHVLQLLFFQKEWAQRPFPCVLTQPCAQFLATLCYGTLSKIHNPISSISCLPKTIVDQIVGKSQSVFLPGVSHCRRLTWSFTLQMNWVQISTAGF